MNCLFNGEYVAIYFCCHVKDEQEGFAIRGVKHFRIFNN